MRHAPLRLQGLAGKVLIVDETHAFDRYMRRELVALLRFHAALGAPVVLLSATLPLAVRQGLVDAFRDGLGAPQQTLAREDYPLVTLAAAAGIEETPCDVRPGLAHRVAVTRLADAEAVVDRINSLSLAGKCAGLGAIAGPAAAAGGRRRSATAWRASWRRWRRDLTRSRRNGG